MTDEKTLTPEEKRVKKIAELEARLQKEKALLNKSTRKKRDNYLFAFGVAIEELYKKATTDEERNQIKKQVCGGLIDRTLDRAVKGFEILNLEFPLKEETKENSSLTASPQGESSKGADPQVGSLEAALK